jgi:hypothetical protein
MYMMRSAAERAGNPLTRSALEALGDVEFYRRRELVRPRKRNRRGRGRSGRALHHLLRAQGDIDGSRVAGAFKAVFAASYVYDDSDVAIWPATDVNYTAKTQYLFRINKGNLDVTNDYDLNAHTRNTSGACPSPT